MANEINHEQLEAQFFAEAMANYEVARNRCKLPAPRFLQMVREYGVVGAARRLLDNPAVQSGLADLILKELWGQILTVNRAWNYLYERNLCHMRL